MSLQLPLIRPRSGKVPGFTQTIKALGGIPAIMFRAIEFGTSQNRLFFELLSEKEKPRPHLREMIVRDQAKRFLERNDFQVEDEALGVGDEPLAALLVRCGPVQTRVLKASDGTVPGCGDSMRRRHFYNQAPSQYRNSKGLITQNKLNLVLLWDFDKNFNLAGLWLTCPMRAGQNSADVLLHWNEPLIHPASEVQHPKPDEARQTAEDELEDLLKDETAEPE